MQAPVPRFSSFRSHGPAPLAHHSEAHPRPPPDNESQYDSNERKQQSRDSAHTVARRQYQSSHASNRLGQIEKRPYRATQEEIFFLTDCGGDKGNARFGSNSREAVPNYRGTAWKTPIGAKRWQSVATPSLLSNLGQRERKALQAECGSCFGMEAYRTDEGFGVLHLVTPDFVSVEPREERKRRAPTAPSDDAGHSEGSTASSDGSESDALTTLDLRLKLEWRKAQAEVMTKNAQLSYKVEVDPRNLQAWRDYIQYQETVISTGLTGRAASPTEVTAIAEVRLSLYSDALANVEPTHPERERFLLEMLAEGSKIWDVETQSKKWRNVAEENLQCLDIQLEQINFVQAATDFSFETCQKLYVKYMDSLRNDTSLSDGNRVERQLYATLRFTTLSNDCGYSELAVGVWQGLMELAFFASPVVEPTESDIMGRFEEFWNSELPRIGEPGGLGWANTKGPPLKGSPSNAPEALAYGVERWALAEERALLHSPLPGRAVDDSGNDPYRVVLFSDIGPHLFTPCPSPKDRRSLFDAFLCFFRLPPASTMCLAWWNDAFLRKSAGDSIALSNALPNLHTLFHGVWDWQRTAYSDFVSLVLYSLVYRSSVRSEASEILGAPEYYMAFLFHFYPGTVRKEGKSMLKALPSNLALYAAYSLSMHLLGREDVAKDIISTALTISGTYLADKYNLIALRQTAIWLALSRKDVSGALTALRAISNDQPTFQILLRGRDEALGCSLSVEHAVIFSELLALEAYLVHANDLSVALDVFKGEAVFLANAGELAVELLHQAQARLIHWHSEITPNFSPSLARSALRLSVLSFPHNTYFLELFARNEARFVIDSRLTHSVRELLDLNEVRTLTSMAFVVGLEARGSSFGSTQHSTRAAFERFLSTRGASNSEALWSAYIRFEVAQNNATRAKSVFFRGLRSLPGIKAFAMLAFTDLASHMKSPELKAIHGLMSDRGIRMHVGFGELTT